MWFTLQRMYCHGPSGSNTRSMGIADRGSSWPVYRAINHFNAPEDGPSYWQKKSYWTGFLDGFGSSIFQVLNIFFSGRLSTHTFVSNYHCGNSWLIECNSSSVLGVSRLFVGFLNFWLLSRDSSYWSVRHTGMGVILIKHLLPHSWEIGTDSGNSTARHILISC